MIDRYPAMMYDNWRRAPCLGCSQVVKRNRDSWVRIMGTRSGTWLMAIGVDPARSLGDGLPPPKGENVSFLGVVHRACSGEARDRIRSGQITFEDNLTPVLVETLDTSDCLPDLSGPTRPGECPFCQFPTTPLTAEDIYPKWFLRELKRREARMFRNGRWTRRIVGPTTPVCGDCNNTWMSVLEKDTKDIVLAMTEQTRLIDVEDQELLATWATKTALLLDIAGGNPVIPKGFGHDLNIKRRPHPAIQVWIAAYSDSSSALVMHRWNVLEVDRDRAMASYITFTIGRIAFQVFFPFLKGSLAPLDDFAGNVVGIWPPKSRHIDWPPNYYFDKVSLEALAKRGYDNREPVVMSVTLSRAGRTRTR